MVAIIRPQSLKVVENPSSDEAFESSREKSNDRVTKKLRQAPSVAGDADCRKSRREAILALATIGGRASETPGTASAPQCAMMTEIPSGPEAKIAATEAPNTPAQNGADRRVA